MNYIEVSILILLLAVLSVPLATRFRIPLEIFLLIASCLVSFFEGLPAIRINPMIVFEVFLPPILFSAAYFTSWRDFKANRTSIALLAIGLVIFSAVSVALTVKLLFPSFSWASCFLLGAIISPTDASSATTLIKKLGAPRQIITILEGESLVNDATALILFRFSIIAIMSGSFEPSKFAMQFIFTVLSGGFIGLLISMIGLKIMQQLKDVQAETTFTFILAFSSYLIAEHLGASGVISTVVAGLYTGRQMPESAESQTKINAHATWRTLLFIINVFVFILIGLELPWVLKNIGSASALTLIGYSLLISIIVICVRFLWIFTLIYIPNFLSKHKRGSMPSWQNLLLVGWSGMRGIVSFAAVLAIPIYVAPGIPFPDRNMLVFLTYCVIVITLIIPSLTLPSLLKFFNLKKEDTLKEEAIARMRALEGVLERIHTVAKNENLPDELLADFCKQLERRIKMIQTQLSLTPYSSLPQDFFALRKLTITALESERETIIKMRKSGEIHDEVFHALSYELDLEDIRAKSLRI